MQVTGQKKRTRKIEMGRSCWYFTAQIKSEWIHERRSIGQGIIYIKVTANNTATCKTEMCTSCWYFTV